MKFYMLTEAQLRIGIKNEFEFTKVLLDACYIIGEIWRDQPNNGLTKRTVYYLSLVVIYPSKRNILRRFVLLLPVSMSSPHTP